MGDVLIENNREGMIREYRRGLLRKILLLVFCIAGIVIVVGLLSLSVYQGLTLGEAYGYILDHIRGETYPLRSPEWWADWYIWNVATVHAVVATLAGAGLACCGALMQSLMNNPLADPYSTGISSGACLGAMASIVMGITVSNLTGSAGTVVNAFLGAMIPAVIIVLISERIRMTPATLILLGTALSMFFGAFNSFMMVTTDADTLQSAYLWQVGNFNNVSWNSVPIMLAVTVVGSIIVMFMSNKLNVLSLGDSSAQSLGIDVRRFRTLALTLMAVMTAAIVAYVGILGFVGLVCPHIVRMVAGSDNKFVISISMAVGALIILVADYISMTNSNLAIGVVVSAIGAPIFFMLIVMARTKGRGAIY